jgi:hypothetical protein
MAKLLSKPLNHAIMYAAPVAPRFVYKGKTVYLQRDLPMGFGNNRPVIAAAHRSGVVTSNGFEGGLLRVTFPGLYGDETAQFNQLSASRYLECDPYR